MEVNAARIPGKWVNPVRVMVALVVLLHVGLFVGGIEPRFAELTQVCDPVLCEPLEPTQADVIALEEIGLSLTFYAVFHIGIEVLLVLVSLLLIGLLFWRASDLWIGVIAILAVIDLATMVANVIYALGEIAPALFPVFLITRVISETGAYLLFYTFPDGRVYPKGTLIPLLLFVPFSATSSALTGADFIDLPTSGSYIVLGAFALISIMIFGFVTQMVRYRRFYDQLQRQQTRWLIASIVGMSAGMIAWVVFFESPLVPPGPVRVLGSFIGMMILMLFSVGLIPYALTIAILRYRLWNIDLIIRRTLIYGVVSALLALVFFGGVAVLQSLIGGLTGQESSLAVVISTLTIAALFAPLRNRVQGGVDRAFYRQKYDARRTLEQFSQTMRDEVDLDRMTVELVEAVEATVQPESMSLWLNSENQ